MNILIIHLNPLERTLQIGLAYITSILEKREHKISFLSLYSLDKKSIEKEMRENKIELILISITSDSFLLAKKVIEFINKKFNVPIVLGGIHPTLQPEECIELEGVLALCRGEGEYPTLELIEAIERNTNYTNIKNLWVKKDGTIYKNELRPLIQNLDELPLPDYKIFEKYFAFEVLPVILTRGCPFDCSYCCNYTLRELHQGKGHYLRRHSVSYCLNLITQLQKKFPSMKVIEFFDDTFTLNSEWLKKILNEFSKLDIKFICNSRFDLLDEDLIKLLSKSGCVKINAAVECGNEEIRKNVLKRNMSDDEIINKARLIKKYGIHLHTHNMVGLPYEKEEDIIKTIKLNKIIGADSIQTSIFTPYPKTHLQELCLGQKWLNKKLQVTSYRDFTILKTPFIRPHLVDYYFLTFPTRVFDSGLKLFLKKMIYGVMHIYHNKPFILYRNIIRNILDRMNYKTRGEVKKIFKLP